MKRILSILSIWCLVQSAVIGTGFEMISDLGTSAATISQGRVQGVAQSPYAIFENPAFIQPKTPVGVSLFATRLFDEVDYVSVAASFKLPKGSLGIGYMSAGVGHIPEAYDNEVTLVESGSFNYKNDLIKLAYQFNLGEKIVFGVSSQYYHQTFADVDGDGLNLDMGVGILLTPTTRISVFRKNISSNKSVAYKDGSKEILLSESYFSLKTAVWLFKPSVQLKIKEGQSSWSGGIEVPTLSPNLVLSGGIHTDYESGVRTQVNSVGVSLLLGVSELHYAYEQTGYSYKPDQHYVSLNFHL